MRPELLDGARRLALHDLGAALDAAGLEGEAREHVQDVTMACFDQVLVAAEATSLPRAVETAVLQLTFTRLWPIVRAHLGPLLVSDPRVARRFREALEALGRAGRGQP